MSCESYSPIQPMRVQEAFFSAEVVGSVFDACFAHSFDDGFATACDTWQLLTPCDKPGPKQGMQTLHAEQPAFHPPLGTPNAWHFVSFFDWDSCGFFQSKNIIPKHTKLESSRDPSAISARWNSNRPGPYLTLHCPLVAKEVTLDGKHIPYAQYLRSQTWFL